jgi:hypothetical protein
MVDRLSHLRGFAFMLQYLQDREAALLTTYQRAVWHGRDVTPKTLRRNIETGANKLASSGILVAAV